MWENILRYRASQKAQVTQYIYIYIYIYITQLEQYLKMMNNMFLTFI